jgi:hypothetical protein
MNTDTRIAIRKPGVKPDAKERPKVNKDFFEGIKKSKMKKSKK